MLRVHADTHAGLRLHKKAGFREFGRRRESRVFAGRRQDEVSMGRLASEFVGPMPVGGSAPNRELA